MSSFPYDATQNPAAPVVDVTIRNPNTTGSAIGVRLILDSGAEQTVIPESVVRLLGIPRDAWVHVTGHGGSGNILGEFSVEMSVAGHAAIGVHVLAVPSEWHCVLGRDVLNRYRIVLDGPQQMLEIG